MYDQLAAEMDKLEDSLQPAEKVKAKQSLGDVLIIAKPIIKMASTLFFLPRNAREILKALVKLIDSYEKGKEPL